MKSKQTLLACYLLLLIGTLFYFPKWKYDYNEATISWDVSGYYLYLPATFIYQDLKQLSFLPKIHHQYRPASGSYQAFEHESGNMVIKYSLGLALQYTPFFLVGHALAGPMGYPPDGFSRPYQLAISLGCLLVAFIGLWFLRKILLRYFSDGVSALTLFTLAFATNYLNYSAIDGAMSHNWLFTLYTLLIWQSIKFHETPSPTRGILIGLLVGLAALTRPTEIIACLIPLLWGIGSWKDARERFQFFAGRKGGIPFILAGISALAVGSLQLIYWKYVSGDWIVYSYQDQGFSWLHPHVKDAMFSYKAGWLTYTPVMGFALLGFLVLVWQRSRLFWPTFIFSGLFMYITFAWDIWWYGGSLGQRAMVQAYPILSIPLAAFLGFALQRKWSAMLLLPALLFFAYYNLWITHHAHKGGLFETEQMTGPYFKAIFLKNEVPSDIKKLLDTDELFRGETAELTSLLTENFEKDTSIHTCSLPPIEGRQSFCLNREVQYSPTLKTSLHPLKNGWVRFAATFHCEQKEWELWRMAQLIGRFSYKGQEVKTRAIRLHRFLWDHTTKRLYLDIKMPEQPFDEVTMMVWNASSDKKLLVDEFEILTFKER